MQLCRPAGAAIIQYPGGVHEEAALMPGNPAQYRQFADQQQQQQQDGDFFGKKAQYSQRDGAENPRGTSRPSAIRIRPRNNC